LGHWSVNRGKYLFAARNGSVKSGAMGHEVNEDEKTRQLKIASLLEEESVHQSVIDRLI